MDKTLQKRIRKCNHAQNSIAIYKHGVELQKFFKKDDKLVVIAAKKHAACLLGEILAGNRCYEFKIVD